MRARRLLTVGLLALGAVAVACGLEVAGEGSGDAPDAAARDAAPDIARSEGAAPAGDAEGDAGADAPVDADAAPDGPIGDAECAANHPPKMVRSGGICVDMTEVTNDQYRAFLRAPDPPALTPECTWNGTYVPEGGVPSTDSLPVLVHWCNAQAYCIWAGKRLCGKIDGGSLPNNGDPDDPKKGQWVAACSDAGAVAYPYGATFDAGACASGAIHPVGVLASCQGPPAGLFDMSGNVWEWVDACNGAAGQQDDCAIMGGSYQSGSAAAELKCRAHFSGKREQTPYGATGFRCCSSP